jgi:hypothetical protein
VIVVAGCISACGGSLGLKSAEPSDAFAERDSGEPSETVTDSSILSDREDRDALGVHDVGTNTMADDRPSEQVREAGDAGSDGSCRKIGQSCLYHSDSSFLEHGDCCGYLVCVPRASGDTYGSCDSPTK